MPGGKPGQETLQNRNREEAGKPFKQKRNWKRAGLLSVHFGFPGQGWAGDVGASCRVSCIVARADCGAGGAVCSTSGKHASSLAESHQRNLV